MTTHEKYEQAFAWYDACLAEKADPEACSQVFNDLLNFLLDNFPELEITQENLGLTQKALKSGHESKDMTADICEATFPMWLVKVVLYQDKISIFPDRVERFKDFVKRYGTLLVFAKRHDLTSEQCYANYLWNKERWGGNLAMA